MSETGLLNNWLESWTAAAAGMVDCGERMLSGTLGPAELGRWFELTTTRGRPSWTTPHRMVFEAPLARLRDFSTTSTAGLVPTLVLPPQAGHDSCIVDYSREQSQIGAIIESGLTRVLSLDWVGATGQTANASVEDYLDVIDRAVEHCGGRVNLIGDCQGGWLATIYTALSPERVNTLTLAGAPIDFHAGEPVIHEVVRRLAPGGHLGFYETLVALGGGVLKGEHMLGGFIMIQPTDEISRQLELLANVDDSRQVDRYAEFEDWFKHTQDIPGAFYLWIVRHLFCDNELVQGTLEVRGQRVDLGLIDMPLALLAGSNDHITPPDQVFAISDYASTPADEIRLDVVPGGHLGLFMGRESLREHWPPLLAGVLAHSKPRRTKRR